MPASRRTKKNTSSIILHPSDSNRGMTPDGIRWQKTGATGDEALDIYLAKGQTIIADKHALNFMDGEAKFDTQMGKFTKAIGRMFSGETAFLNHITGTDDTKLQRINLGMSISGDLIYLPIPVGKKWRVSKGAFLAGTQNTIISSSTKIVRVDSTFTGEGFILSELSAKEGDAGAWISSYGHIVKHELKNNEVLYVNNNLFLASDNDVEFSVKNIGNFKSIITGGEALVMKFKGPCEIYTQSKDVTGLLYTLAGLVSNNKSGNKQNKFIFGDLLK
jgi:uncharacterized protein (AIM24 family)